MPKMYVCAKFESDSCISSYFFRTITTKITPVKIITDIYTAAQITDIYTAAHPCKYQLLPELICFENYFFENIFFEFCFVFNIFFYY